MLGLSALPRLALSVRNPWAWAIIDPVARKDIENRDWRRGNPNLAHRGRVAIHASQGMTRAEYEDAAAFMADRGVVCPPARDLKRGGIIGTVEIAGMVRESNSAWFCGPLGLVLKDPRPCEFVPALGELGFFAWRPADPSTIKPAPRWIAGKPEKPVTPDLFGDR